MSAAAGTRVRGPVAGAWPLMIAAAAILLVTTGARQSLGLYIAPLHQSTGLGIADISLAPAALSTPRVQIRPGVVCA